MKPPNQTAIAAGLGLTRAAVSKLKKAGMPVSSVREAMAWRALHVAPRQTPLNAGGKGKSAFKAESPFAPPETDSAEAIDYAKARARREHFGANLAEIEVEIAKSRLVERATVESAVFDAFRALRDRVMAAPRRCASAVAPLSDLREIEAVIAEELRRSFDAFEQHVSEQLATRIAPVSEASFAPSRPTRRAGRRTK